jgi:hypothetical protein
MSASQTDNWADEAAAESLNNMRSSRVSTSPPLSDEDDNSTGSTQLTSLDNIIVTLSAIVKWPDIPESNLRSVKGQYLERYDEDENNQMQQQCNNGMQQQQQPGGMQNNQQQIAQNQVPQQEQQQNQQHQQEQQQQQ